MKKGPDLLLVLIVVFVVGFVVTGVSKNSHLLASVISEQNNS